MTRMNGEDLSQDRKTLLERTLRHRILSMELAPGASLGEVSLAREFGLSRPPVRELLRQLSAEGFIELEAHRAARVASMSFDSMRHFFLAAPIIYVATAKLAATHASDAEIDNLKRIQQRFRTAMERHDVDERVLVNDQFHYAIGEMARNPYLLPSFSRFLIDHARLGRTFYQPGKAAGEVVRKHLNLTRKNMAAFVAPNGIVVRADSGSYP